jgi:hypothetical protein
MTSWDKIAKNLAEGHVDWFLKTVRPLMIEHFIHGYKHGMDKSGLNGNFKDLDRCATCGRVDGSHHSDCRNFEKLNT